MTSEFAVAIHVLVYLDKKGRTLSSEAIAENVCTNPARIRKVMAKLKKANLIDTREGVNGGYHMVQSQDVSLSANEITLGQICWAIGTEPVKVSWHSGAVDRKCQIASGMTGAMEEIYADLNRVCMERLNQITVSDVEKRIKSFSSDKE